MVSSEVFNQDCVAGMKQYPDKHFDLAIVDPPYGIGQDWKKRNSGKLFKETSYKNISIPDKSYFDELKRVSRYQIIWGYNYYTDCLGATNYLICWDKQSNNNQVFKYSKFELAYTNIKVPANLISIPWDGYRMGKETGQKKIHPHQKPIALYKWLFDNYAKSGWKILDTHLGSGASRIAAYDMGFDFTGFEIDETYFNAGNERFEEHKRQQSFNLHLKSLKSPPKDLQDQNLEYLM